MATVEDIILSKLDWYRIGGEASERQWNDLTTVAKLNARLLNIDYLNNWSHIRGLLQLLERLLNETSGAGSSFSND